MSSSINKRSLVSIKKVSFKLKLNWTNAKINQRPYTNIAQEKSWSIL